MTSTNFTFNNIVYTANEKNTYFYCWPESRKGERTRIKKADFEAAYNQYTEATKHHAVVEGRKVTGSDLQVPAVINQHGCVDCSKCNVQNCPHRDCFRRNPYSIGGIAECPRLKIKAEEPKVEEPTTEPETPKAKKTRKSKDIAFTYSENGETVVTLTAKQVDFVKHLSDTCFWENGLESCIWVDCLCDDIGGQFAGKPMTVGAMISTLCEKGLGIRGKQKVNGRKCTSFELTDLGMKVFAGAEWGLE